MEIWKDVKGYEGLYKVSNLGRIKSFRKSRHIILKNRLNPYGYYTVALCNNGLRNMCVHKLVLNAFLPNPKNKPQGNHINGIKTDNRVINLEWVTRSENIKHAYKIGLIKNAGRKKIPVLQFDLYGRFIAEYTSQSEAGKKTGTFKNSISLVCAGKLYSAGGYLWRAKK